MRGPPGGLYGMRDVDGGKGCHTRNDATRNAPFGPADGGAHCGLITDASILTFLLAHSLKTQDGLHPPGP